MPKPRSRERERLRFTVSSARTVRLPEVPEGPPLLPWPVAALGGGLAAALAGTLLVVGVLLVAWLSATAIALPTVLGFAAQVWLLAHGGVLMVGSDPVSLVPLGLTVAFAALGSAAGRFAYRQGRQARAGAIGDDLRLRLVWGSVGQVAAGYTLYAAVLAGAVTGLSGAWRPALGALVVSAGGSAVGACRAAGYRPWSAWPDWLRRGLRGAAAGGLALVVVAAATLGLALVLGEQRVGALEDALQLDGGGVFVWSLVGLAYLPTILAWTLAWLLGAGFTVGTGSLVSLSTTQLGMLPSLPVLGALPPAGVADQWMLLWLAAGVLAGALAGIVAVRSGRTSLTGTLAAAGVAGLLSGLLYLVWAAASRGGLGSLRLVDLGPRLPESLLIPVPLLVLSAVLGGLGCWFVRRRRPSS
jgi:hypothetical protein